MFELTSQNLGKMLPHSFPLHATMAYGQFKVTTCACRVSEAEFPGCSSKVQINMYGGSPGRVRLSGNLKGTGGVRSVRSRR
jgi:hypothetical protein